MKPFRRRSEGASSPHEPAPRDPAIIMAPGRLSATKACRLSFVRSFVRRMVRERWQFLRRSFEIDEAGRGTAVYRIITGSEPLHFVAFSDDLPEAEKSERIIANHYDGEGFLCCAEPDAATIAAQRDQMADFLFGRADSNTIGWTRVSRSSHSFNLVVDALAEGRQPDLSRLAEGGYLMRNNGYWGNGRHGAAVFPAYAADHPLRHPYYAEMLALFMWRHFSFELAEHMARARAPRACRLDKDAKRFLGVGNGSGLGMVPFVIRHPRRIHQWITARETALAQIKALPLHGKDPHVARLLALVERAISFYSAGPAVADGVFTGSVELVDGLRLLRAQLDGFQRTGRIAETTMETPGWSALLDWAGEALDIEVQELLVSVLIELHPEIADPLDHLNLVAERSASEVDPLMPAPALRGLIERDYGWALACDRKAPQARHWFWYLSEENLEPRLGQRGSDPGEAFETFVDVVGLVQSLHGAFAEADDDLSVGEFLLARPDQRFAVARVQMMAGLPYGEVRANVVGADFQPCHLIRFALALYGMEKFEAKSAKWVRGTFLQGAPLAEEIARGIEGDWVFPLLPGADREAA